MRVMIDPDKCIASGACVMANPELFAQDEDGIVYLLQADPTPETAHKTREAAGACPAMVIEIEE